MIASRTRLSDALWHKSSFLLCCFAQILFQTIWRMITVFVKRNCHHSINHRGRNTHYSATTMILLLLLSSFVLCDNSFDPHFRDVKRSLRDLYDSLHLPADLYWQWRESPSTNVCSWKFVQCEQASDHGFVWNGQYVVSGLTFVQPTGVLPTRHPLALLL